MRERAFPEKPEMHQRAKRVGESVYDYCSHSAGDMATAYRLLAEQWLHNYPDQHLSAFLRRFKGKRDDDHNSAFFELFLHEYLRKLCDKIAIEEEIANSGKRADFGLRYRDGSMLAVEALSIQPIYLTGSPNIELVNEYVRELSSPDFMISFLTSKGELSHTPKKRDVQRWAHEVLSQYSWEDANTRAEAAGNRAVPVEPLRLGAWEIDAVIWVKQPEERNETSALGMHAGGGEVHDYQVPAVVRDRVLKKINAKTTSQSSVPFILAVNINEPMLRPGEEEMEVLHGYKHRIQFSTVRPDDRLVNPNATSVFSPDGTEGVWLTIRNRSQYRRCSAIWFFHQVGVANPRGSRHTMYLNPFTEHDYRELFLHHFSTAGIGLPG